MTHSPIIAPFRRFAEKHYLKERLKGERLDHYLAHGWYRMGATIFTTHFLSYRDGIYSAIWIRLPLANYSFRKSVRKIIRRVERDYVVSIQPAKIDLERELLFKKYKQAFDGMLSSSIEKYLLDDTPVHMYDTWEVSIRHNGRLVGLSYFDRGKESIESIVGIYDPAYKGRSIGFYTMLREIQYGIDNGYSYFYPGYITPGNERFAYKTRIGKADEIEYYSLESFSWKKLSEFEANTHGPLELINTRLGELQKKLSKSGLAVHLLQNPIFEINLIPHIERSDREEYLDFPLILTLKKKENSLEVIVYDPRNGHYKLLNCQISLILLMQFNDYLHYNYDPNKYLQLPLQVREVQYESSQLSRMVDYLLQRYGRHDTA